MDHSESKIITIKVCEAYTEEGVQVREQVCQVAKEGDIFGIRHKIEAKFEPTFNPEHWLHERINPGG